MTDSGIPEVKLSPAVNGLQTEALRTRSSTVASSTKSSPSWDEDWGPTKGTAPSVLNSIDASSQSVAGNPVGQLTSLQKHLPLSAVSNQQATTSCPSVDIEWPPRASFGVTPQNGDAERATVAAGTSSTSNNLDDIDPFADWPPRPGGSLTGGSGISSNGTFGTPMNKMTSTSSNMGLQTSNNWSLNSRSSADALSLNLGNSISATGSLNSGLGPQNSLGFLKQSQQLPASTVTYNNTKSTDLGSIFASNKNEQTAPKLAPPPSTTAGVGRGRGRGRGAASTARSSQTKSHSEQPPLLDLLG